MRPSLRAEVLQQLGEMGSDITRPHNFDFYLYFPSEDTAKLAAAKCRESEFVCEVMRGATHANWLCRATITIMPNDAPLDKVGKFFNQIVVALKGDFDGWESDVVK